MLKSRCKEIAEQNGLGKIHFETKVVSSGAILNVGYILDSKGKRDLFCKAQSRNPDCFYLCNEYELLSPEESKSSRV